MDRANKEALVADFNDKFSRAQLAVVADYRGIDANTMVEFRKNLAQVGGVEFHVVKNSLARLAVAETAFTGLATFFEGPNAILLGYDDVVEACKVLTDFAKDNEEMEVKGGVMDGALLDKGQVKALSALPPKEVLQAQLLGVLQGPSRNLVSLLANANRQIVNVLSAYRDKLESDN